MTGKIQNAVAEQNNTVTGSGKKYMQNYVKSMEKEIAKALPAVITPERFTRMVLSAISTNEKLGSCTPTSFMGAMMQAAQLGVEPNTPLGQAYIIPYENRGVLEAQFQLGYKGLIDLAYRSEEIAFVDAQVIYANDKFECEFGLEPKLRLIPADGDRGEAVKFYAIFKTKSGGFGFKVMSVTEIKTHAAKYSKGFASSYSPWKTSFEEMALKTVLKRCLKYAPLKSDFVRAVVQDETIKNGIAEDMYDVPAEAIVVDAVEVKTVDETTGEVVGNE